MTESLYEAVREASSQPEHRIRVSRVLEILGVSKSGYYDWLKREPSDRDRRKAEVQKAIKDIYDVLYYQGYNFTDAIARVREGFPESVERDTILSFIENSKRGIVRAGDSREKGGIE